MAVAYVDTSVLLAIAFGETGARRLARQVTAFTTLVSANLLVAEFLAAHRREGVHAEAALLARLAWVLPDRPLDPEVARVLDHGYVRGADCWHLAVALYVAADPGSIAFLTADAQQGASAASLGFRRG
jgi:predicted nucleic acid-binding protein